MVSVLTIKTNLKYIFIYSRDGDGTPDYLDVCPFNPQIAKVDFYKKYGCLTYLNLNNTSNHDLKRVFITVG